ncbi:sec24-related protein [Mycena galericulata]|nr:sec24-related protein [Mycena galericulata]
MYAHSNHIPQPPHSAGRRLEGFRRRIDPNQIPSAVEAIEFDRHQWEDTTFLNLPGEHVPFSTSDFVALDQGNSSPKFVRMTTWNIPNTSRLAGECAVPMAAVFQPFADLDPREEPVPFVDLGERGPARCESCRAYINPWCTWTRGGNAWKCNLCAHETEVSPDYFCNLDGNLRRIDHLQRPELNRGTIDFANHHPLVCGQPLPMNFVFVFDVSNEALRSGALHTACAALHDILFGDNAYFPPQSEMAILTFDTTLHFHDLSSDLVPMLVLSDIDEVFVPLRSGLFVKPAERRTAIEGLLDALPQRFAQITYIDAALGSVIRASLAALAGRGGHVVVFQSTMPSIGPGALHGEPSEVDLYDTPKETSLYAPRDNTWRDIGTECAEEGIGVSLFLTMSKYIDVGSIGVVASMTGGELFYHPRFTPARDGAVLHAQFRRLMQRTTVYNCTMRVRTSNGIRISDHCGNFYQRGPTDLEFGVLDADKAVSVTLQHSGGTLNTRGYVFLQSAVLYTTVDGLRRVRTCNLALPIVELAWNVFRLSDLDATVYYLARRAVMQMASEKMANIRDDLTENCSSILLAYRNKCSNTSSADQLILPEAFKGLPIYTLAIIKSKCLRGRYSCRFRLALTHLGLLSSTKRFSRTCGTTTHTGCYPRVCGISCSFSIRRSSRCMTCQQTVGCQDPATGRIVLPDIMRDSHLYMEAHGVYLIDNGEAMLIWIGGSVSPQLLLDLFGVDDLLALDSQMSELPRLETHLSTQVHNILAHRRLLRGGRISKFFISRQNLDAAELEFSDMLVEDQNTGAMAYTDCMLDRICACVEADIILDLSVVHNQIKQVLRDGGSIGGGATIRGSIW